MGCISIPLHIPCSSFMKIITLLAPRDLCLLPPSTCSLGMGAVGQITDRLAGYVQCSLVLGTLPLLSLFFFNGRLVSMQLR